MSDTHIGADILDIRDLIERIEELREERKDFEHDEDGNLTGASWADAETDDAEELSALESFVEQLRSMGGDHEWEGSWFPVVLVRDSYFTDFAEEEAEQLDLIKKDGMWPNNHIDWEAAAAELRQDYSAYDYAGETYWARN